MRLSATYAVRLAVVACLVPLYGCGDPVSHGKDDANKTAESPDASWPDAKARTVQEAPSRFQENLYSELTCNIEALNGATLTATTSVKVRKVLHMAGWFFDETTKTVPGDVKVRFQAADGQSAWEQKISGSVDRPDVVTAFGGSQGILKSGFGADIDFTGVKLGEYQMFLSAQTGRGERLCGRWRVTLTE